MDTTLQHTDVVMLGTFAAWNLGTLQARALPLASEIAELGVRATIVTTPWDLPSEAGAVDVVGAVLIINTRSISTRAPLKAVSQQLRWVRQMNPSLIHIFKPKGFGALAGRALMRSLPVIVDSDDWEGDGGWNQAAGYSALQQRVFQFQERDLLKNARHVTAASTLLAERARQLRDSENDPSVHRIENGLTSQRLADLAVDRCLPPSRIDPPVVVLYSRFAEFESDWLPRFIDALESTASRPLTLRIVGDAGRQPDHRLTASRVNIETMGYVSYSSISAILGGSTLAVYPYRDSLITRSKQSVKLLELMAAGCPVVASDVGDITATIGNGGVCVDGAAPNLFARTVTQLLESPSQLDSMSSAGMARARSRYGFKPLAKRLLEIYRAAGLR